MRFSLIIATKGRPEVLRDALRSAAIALPRDSEAIVVDGDAARSAEATVREVAAQHPTLELRYLPSDPGAALQRNVGIDAASGDVVVFVDDDCTLEPGLFEALANAYADPSVVGATGRVHQRVHPGLGGNPRSRLRQLMLGGGKQGSVTSFGFRRSIVDVERPRDVEFMPGPLMSARREVASAVRFDERLTGYSLGEDDDFSYRVSRRGRIRYEPAAQVQHRELGWQRMDRRQVDRLRVLNRTYLFRKNFPQTRSARAGFAAMLGVLCAHRALNRNWSGLRGLIEGMIGARTREPG